jgi:HPt (histidine-containing phosphotransfer) domain-containing protein
MGPHPADEDTLDEVILGELFETMGADGGQGLVTAYDLFLTGVPARLAQMDAALAEGCFDDAARAAHTLKGSAGSFGARRLSALTALVEQRCRHQDRAGATRLVDEMGAEFAIVRDLLADRLSRLAVSTA